MPKQDKSQFGIEVLQALGLTGHRVTELALIIRPGGDIEARAYIQVAEHVAGELGEVVSRYTLNPTKVEE